jgi:hypothetical protein
MWTPSIGNNNAYFFIVVEISAVEERAFSSTANIKERDYTNMKRKESTTKSGHTTFFKQ